VRSAFLGAAIFGALGALLGGCILLVSPREYGTQCRFAGADSECGACVVARCQTDVDTCCGADACSSTLGSLEACASNHDQSCGRLAPASSTSTDPATAGLRTCIARGCSAECQAFAGTSETTCKELPLAPGASCSCTTKSSAGANDYACSAAVFPSTRCCAPNGWPAPGLECTCKHVECIGTPGGCFCSLVDHMPDQETCGGTDGLTCCASTSTTKDAQCTCGTRACFIDEVEVTSCSSEVMGCGLQRRVESCSSRTP
jgi:hypothetical protein